MGDFTGNGATDVLFYYPGDDNWWLASVVNGQFSWSLVGNTAGFGHGIYDGRPFWIGDFTGDGITDVLFYYPGDDNWWLGSVVNGQLSWALVGNTAGFGHAINDGRPFWTGDFTGNGATDVLFYYPGDDNWWLGSIVNGQLTWSFVGNTAGFGHAIYDGRPFWIGDFTGDGSDDVLFYFPGDDNWWLGSLGQVSAEDPRCAVLRSDNNRRRREIRDLEASKAGLNPRDPIDRAEILKINREITGLNQQITAAEAEMAALHCPRTPNPGGTQLQWSLVGNTAGFGHAINDGRPFWIGDFTGNGATDVLFYFPGDDNWWLGSVVNGQLIWALVGNTIGFGRAIYDGRPFWTGDFTGNGATDVLFYYPGDDNWWLGSIVNSQLTWALVGNTVGFGHAINDGRPFWTGDFNGNGTTDILFYYPGDGNWWLGPLAGGQLQWSLLGNTGRPCAESIVVHFKTLVSLTTTVQNFIDGQFAAMELLFAQSGVAAYRGSTEDLSGNQNLSTLLDLDVGQCLLGQPTTEQNQLYANRNNAANDDLVVYVLRSLQGGTGNFVGCATHPSGRPGAAVVQANADWLTAHELGHVLGLRHVASTPTTNSDFLMWPNTGWTNVPPDISSSEASTMLASSLSHRC
jgi:hypothetical protein